MIDLGALDYLSDNFFTYNVSKSTSNDEFKLS